MINTFIILNFVLLVWVVLLTIIFLVFYIIKKLKSKKTSFSKLGNTTKVHLIYHLKEAIIELSKSKTGAIITIQKKDDLSSFRTDGLELNANISSTLLIAIFNKKSPLHDGAVIIKDNKITYASTYFKITGKSINNKYGARHRAAMGISEQTDAITIVVSEENGDVTIAKLGKFFSTNLDLIQENLLKHLVN
ncbi:DNA integrity scanning protein DisA nucleotide-binding domain protein [Mycoplasma iguanae]|uniref:DNA integrity scanning protein DisA nucleotide-binding domain protein n=1 Tax=Mycoplasma iguanae TaxID=292461 RepID=A0ABY5R933_9MOLU|nr:DNA integrity scanning protein DisA nucleotide-binding domain protein [Mycoplasma iguanae]UVD81821.1 DNA integrity scanning protein DisA nucleotide-binding domain protein [Mycoplasma iguanae]